MPDDTGSLKHSIGMNDHDWQRLIKAIGPPTADGPSPLCRCTPFLGPEFSADLAPREIARKWCNRIDSGELEGASLFGEEPRLSQLAQFVAVHQDDYAPRLDVQKEFADVHLPKNADSNDPRVFLADLPMPLYVTTYYDNLMFEALQRHSMRKPQREFCRWNPQLDDEESYFDQGQKPDAANPLVFHLYGQADEPDSLVLTDHDYLDFLAHISEDPKRIPGPIAKAFRSSYLLFLGYRMFDLEFMVLLRLLSKHLDSNPFSRNRVHLSVQFVPEHAECAEDYLKKYFSSLSMSVYCGTCDEFIAELRRRWQEAIHVG